MVPLEFQVGDATTTPFVSASYQVTVTPAGGATTAAVNVWGGTMAHSAKSIPVRIAGFGLIVKMTWVRVLLGHPEVLRLASA